MRLDELKWHYDNHGERDWAIFSAGDEGTVLVTVKSDGTYNITARTKRWRGADPLTAQALLIELTSGGKDALP